jgi:hypothetical protein
MASQLCYAISRYLSRIPCLHLRIFSKQVHVPPVAPPINCHEIVVTGVRIGGRETTLTQPGQLLIELS